MVTAEEPPPLPIQILSLCLFQPCPSTVSLTHTYSFTVSLHIPSNLHLLFEPLVSLRYIFFTSTLSLILRMRPNHSFSTTPPRHTSFHFHMCYISLQGLSITCRPSFQPRTVNSLKRVWIFFCGIFFLYRLRNWRRPTSPEPIMWFI